MTAKAHPVVSLVKSATNLTKTLPEKARSFVDGGLILGIANNAAWSAQRQRNQIDVWRETGRVHRANDANPVAAKEVARLARLIKSAEDQANALDTIYAACQEAFVAVTGNPMPDQRAKTSVANTDPVDEDELTRLFGPSTDHS